MREFLFAARSCLGFLTTIPVGISMEGLAALGSRGYWRYSMKTFHGTVNTNDAAVLNVRNVYV